MALRKINPFATLTFLGTLAYPVFVYNYIGIFPPLLFAAFGILLIGLRLISMRKSPSRTIWMRAFIIAAVSLVFITILNTSLAAKAYPIIVSLTLALVFGLSLLYPPTVVERMARITQPNLSAHGVSYTRKVTIVWLVFLLTNAAISTATALWGSLAQWALWNGLISYLLMGTLFSAEYLVRRKIQR